MDATCISYEERLEGASNYNSWKVRATLVFIENRLWYSSNSTVTLPTNPRYLVSHKLKDVKTKRIILDTINDNLIPHIVEKNSSRNMWEDLTSLYQSSNHNRKMTLKEELRSTKISKTDTVASYLIRVTYVHDKLAHLGRL